MSVLRPVVRRSKAFGAQLPAIVEETNLGLATIRLAPNGARLTNLPTLGDVKPGDDVIVDYATGEPYVRPTTIIEAQETVLEESFVLPEDVEVPPVQGNPAICAAKLEGSQQPSYEWRWDEYSVKYKRYSRIINFNITTFDPDKLSNGSGVTFREGGMYFWSIQVALSTGGCGQAWQDATVYANVLTNGIYKLMGPWKTLRTGSNPLLATINGLFLFAPGECLAVRTSSCGDLVLRKKGEYPMLTVWKVSDSNSLHRVIGS